MGLDKLQRALLVGDQAQLLREGAKADRWYQRLQERIAENEAAQRGVSVPSNGEPAAADDGMNINVDSPTTVYNGVPQASSSGVGILAKLAMGAALLAGGGGLGAGAMALIDAFRPKPAAVAPSADANTQYQLNLLPEEPVK